VSDGPFCRGLSGLSGFFFLLEGFQGWARLFRRSLLRLAGLFFCEQGSFSVSRALKAHLEILEGREEADHSPDAEEAEQLGVG